MNNAYICDAVRTPIGRYGGGLSTVRTDDLAALPIKALMERNPNVDWNKVDDVIYGCANQAGEDNRNVARMALLLAGIDVQVPGATLNRRGHCCTCYQIGRSGLDDCWWRRKYVARAFCDGQGRVCLFTLRQN